MNNNKVIDAIAPAFTALMIEKIQNLKTGWSKPWVSMAQGTVLQRREPVHASSADRIQALQNAYFPDL